MVFVLDGCCKLVPVGLDLFLLIRGNSEDDLAVAGDGVVHLTGVPLCQEQRHLRLLEVKESCDNLNGVGALLLDVIAGVSTVETFEAALQEEVAFGGILTLELERGDGATATGAGDKDLPLVLGVEIDEVVAGHKSSLHT